MLKNILLDLDDTILDFHKAEKAAVKKALTALGIRHDEEVLARYSVLNLAQWKLLEQGKLTRPEVKVRRFELLFSELGCDCSAEKAAAVYEGLLGIGHYFIDGAEEMLRELSKDYPLFLASNGTASVQQGRIKSAGIEKYFAGIFISEQIGFNKPDARFFEYCFKHMPDFKKEETVIIGDSLSSDIQGGINSGIRTVWFNPSGKTAPAETMPNYQISRLCELNELVKQL